MLTPGENLIQVARVLKSNGTEGQVVLGFRNISPEEINSQEPVFIYFDGSPVPFFISAFEPKGNRAFAHLTDIRTLADTEEIIGKDVYVQESSIAEDEVDPEDLSFLVGWTLYDAASGRKKRVGEIVDFEDIPSNPCIAVVSKGEEVLIPLHEDLIKTIDPEKEEIVMTIPQGLL